jgi:hypothetical protein
MIGFIGTSLQLQLIITAHALNSIITTSVWRISPKNLSLVSTLSNSWIRCLLWLLCSPDRSYHFQGFHYGFSWMCCLGNILEPLPNKINNSLSGSTIPAFGQRLLSIAQKSTVQLVVVETYFNKPLSSNGLFHHSILTRQRRRTFNS